MANLNWDGINKKAGDWYAIERREIVQNYSRCSICQYAFPTPINCSICNRFICHACLTHHKHDSKGILICTCNSPSNHFNTCAASRLYYYALGLSHEKWEEDEKYRKENCYNNTVISDLGLPAWKCLVFSGDGHDFVVQDFKLLSRGNTIWEYNKPIKAIGEMQANEYSPGPGIYSYRNEFSSRCLGEGGQLIVKIRIWGKVLQYSEGYKSEYAMLDIIYSEIPEVRANYPQARGFADLNFDGDFNMGGNYIRNCKNCGKLILLSPEKVHWFGSQKMQLPKRCKECCIVQKQSRRLVDIYREKKGEKK